MPNECAISTWCPNNSRKTDKTVSYFHFPKTSDIRKKWIHACKRKDTLNPDNARICSDHFLVTDYIRDLKAELLGYVPVRRLLNKDAVPSLNLPGKILIPCSAISPFQTVTTELQAAVSGSSTSETCTPSVFGVHSPSLRQNRIEKRQIRKRALENVYKLSPKKKKLDMASNTDVVDCFKCSVFSREIHSWKMKFNRMSIRAKCAESQVVVLRAKVSKLQTDNKKVKAILVKKDNSLAKLVQNEMEKICSSVLSKAQIQCLVNRKKKGRWTKDDIAKSLTLRSISKRSYQYRRKIGEPHPGLSTLRRWTKSFHCKRGIMMNVIHLMNTKGKSLKENERLTVLSFDEMNIDSRLCYDQSEDKVYGPHQNVQVIMARGLCSQWKQPIYYDFDRNMSSGILKEVIQTLERIDYNVVGVVSDMGAKNATVWNELKVSYKKTSFVNPSDESRSVWVFADVPHLLKLLRNHILDTGIRLSNGKQINGQLFRNIIEKDCGETRICHHLTDHHISVTGRDRQKVRVAAQLLSGRTATALQYVLQDKEASDFVNLVNDTFDVLNSRIPLDQKKKLCSGFGMLKKEQMDVINKFASVCLNMRVGKKKNLLPFQKGFMLSIRSLKGLYNDLTKKGIKHILTSRLNQDCLENLFSQLRGLGHFYDHPSPIEIKHRLRILLLGANAADVNLGSTATPVEKEDTTTCQTYVTSEMFLGLPDMDNLLKILEEDLEDRGFTIESNQTTQPDIVQQNSSQNLQKSFFSEGIEESRFQAGSHTNDLPYEGLRYIAGYVAHKCSKYDKTLGIITSKLPALPMSPCVGWIETVSRGGLLVPSNEWLQTVEQMELLFAMFHGQSVSKVEKVVENLCQLLQEKFSTLHKNVIKTYVRTRTFIRLWHLNSGFKQEEREKRAARKALKWLASSQVQQK